MSGETEHNVSGWTVDTLHQLLVALLADQDRRMVDGFTAQHTLLMTLAEERQRAVDMAFEAAKSETHEHLEQARRETQSALEAHDKYFEEIDRRTALQFRELEKSCLAAAHAQARMLEVMAAERQLGIAAAFDAQQAAVAKSETANEKRFESVNEFRAQLTDQAARFITRTETDTIVAALRHEVGSSGDRNAERIQELTDRINRTEGKGQGLNAGWIYVLGFIAAVGTIVSFYLAARGG